MRRFITILIRKPASSSASADFVLRNLIHKIRISKHEFEAPSAALTQTVHSRAGFAKVNTRCYLQAINAIRSCLWRAPCEGNMPGGFTVINTLRITVVLGVTTLMFGQDAVVQKSSVHTDTVKRGAMTRAVRGPAVLVRNSIAEVSIPSTQAQEIRPGQSADIDTGRLGVVKGKVIRVLPVVASGVSKVEVQAERTLPEAHPTLDVLVQLEVLPDVLYVGRPAVGSAQAEGVLFKLDGDERHATKVNVRYGRTSVNTVEVLSGLQPGDQVILTDMSAFATKDRVRLQ